jgi:acetyltransferase-like isoleucine patch superfamily enzyme
MLDTLRQRVRRAAVRRRAEGDVALGAGVSIGRDVLVRVATGGRLVLGDGCVLGDRCRLDVGMAGTLIVGAGARLGERCSVTAHERVEIGADCVLGAEAVILDFDHVVGDPEVPVRLQGIVTAPVRIGDRATLDATAVVLRGVTVGPGARVGVRSVVRADVVAGGRVAGVPARAPEEAGRPPRGRPLVRRH